MTNQKELRETLADLQHKQWSGWMNYLFGKCEHGTHDGFEDGSLVIPAWAVERWKRQAATPYFDLPDNEKESDRIEADKYLPLIDQECRERQEGRKETMSEEELRTMLSRLFVNWTESPFIDPIFHLAIEEYAKFREAAVANTIKKGVNEVFDFHKIDHWESQNAVMDFYKEQINQIIDKALTNPHEPAE
jgi:hypothetical protein